MDDLLTASHAHLAEAQRRLGETNASYNASCDAYWAAVKRLDRKAGSLSPGEKKYAAIRAAKELIGWARAHRQEGTDA